MWWLLLVACFARHNWRHFGARALWSRIGGQLFDIILIIIYGTHSFERTLLPRFREKVVSLLLGPDRNGSFKQPGNQHLEAQTLSTWICEVDDDQSILVQMLRNKLCDLKSCQDWNFSEDTLVCTLTLVRKWSFHPTHSASTGSMSYETLFQCVALTGTLVR